MFDAGRWAEAYLAACEKDGEDPSCGLAFLEAVLPLAARVSSIAPGTRTADMVTATVEKAAEERGITGIRAATALVWLFMRRESGHDAEKYIRLTEAVGHLLDKRQGVLRVALETATPDGIDERFLRDLEVMLMKKHGAKTVLFKTKTNPALVGGYRWLVEGERTDCSLAGRLSQMERALKNAGA
jgi:hypothetical protein